MAERDSWAVGSTSDRRVSAEDARLGIGALLAPGTTPINTRAAIRLTPGSPALVQATGTPGINVTCNAFQAAINASRGAGPYVSTLDATKTIAILDVPADPSNARWDLIVAQQSDVDYGDANRDFKVVRILGAAAASPSDPVVNTTNGAPTNSPDYILIARVRVTAGATVVTNAMIDDLRPGWLVALGGVLPVASQTVRDALTGTRYAGLTVYRQDRNWLESFDGTGWRVQGTAYCTSTSDRDSVITTPYNGQLAATTDTGSVWERYAGAWVRVAFGAQLVAVKAADESVTSSTTLQNDDHLLFALEANATYALDGYLYYSGAADGGTGAGGLKMDWTLPASASMHWSSFAVNSGTNPLTNYDAVSQVNTDVRNYATNGPTALSMQPKGVILTGGTPGTAQSRWAQVNSNATATTIKAGSWLRLQRIA